MIIILMGVSGCGKTTVGRLLAERLGWEFLDGDNFHPPDNVTKMSRGTPLTDADRAGWLDRLAGLITESLQQGRSVVLACSALKQSYRDRLTVSPRQVRFVYLKGSRELIGSRLLERAGHFMPPGLLESQFKDLEEPGNALVVDIRLSPEENVELIISYFRIHV